MTLPDLSPPCTLAMQHTWLSLVYIMAQPGLHHGSAWSTLLLLLFICIAYNYNQGLLIDAFMMLSQTKMSSDHA